ncbi:TPA: hypothetical protein ACIJNF_001762 [Klebsiella pneumoniae]
MNQVKSLKQLSYGGLAAAVLLIIVPQEAFAMHIMEGFLPPMWALAWWRCWGRSFCCSRRCCWRMAA